MKWLVPVVLMVVGVSLGLTDQGAGGTPNGLRVPALVAALLLVAQGFDMMMQATREPTPVGVGNGGELRRAATAVGRAYSRAAPTSGSASRRAEALVALGLTVLAVWLGLATLRYPEAPPLLGALSLVASFLLFAFGWKVLTNSNA